jgi:serine/threonine-protein kinase HipA
MVFNILAHNRDDHTKNFAFRMSPDGEWSLTPVYDITYSGGPGGEHTLLVNGEGRVPTRAHAEAVAARASIEPRESREVISQVEEAVADWPVFAKEQGVSNDSIQTIRKRMASVYASFIDQSARTLAEATDASRSRVARQRRRRE